MTAPRRWRLAAKCAAASGLHLFGADRLWSRRSGGLPPVIIAYHRVVEDFRSSAARSLPGMLISAGTLSKHLDWLGRHYRLVSLDELGRLLEEDPVRRTARPPAAVTFDDGYRDVHAHALPLLRRKGIPATVFVVSGLVGTGKALIHDRLFHLLHRAYSRWPSPRDSFHRLLESAGIEDRQARRLVARSGATESTVPALLEGLSREMVERLASLLEDRFGSCTEARQDQRPLTWSMVADLEAAGITIGSHGRRHLWMNRESPRALLQEAGDSRRALEARLGRPVHHFAYPGGAFDRESIRAVSRAGYRFAYTICRHRDDEFPLLTISRRVFWEKTCSDRRGLFSPALMSCQVHGVFHRFPCRHRAPRPAPEPAADGRMAWTR